MIIGMTLNEALLSLNGQNIEIKYNNSDKLVDFDTQLVVSYKNFQDKIVLVVGNFKLKV